jgi:hypothetical protein
MYGKMMFTDFFQADFFEGSVKTDFSKNILKGAGKVDFTDFLRKFQNNDFAFSKSANTATTDLNDIFQSLESKKKLVSLVVDRMQEALRQAADNSSFVSFQTTEIISIKKLLISTNSFSDEDIEGLLENMESGLGSGEYLPDLISTLEDLKIDEIDIEDVHFPFSSVPYFETALESIGVEIPEIKDVVESALDTEKGFSISSFLSSLESLKEEAQKNILNLKGSEFEKADSKIKGLDTIMSVFKIEETEDQSFLNIDKKSLENLLSGVEESLVSSNKETRDLFKDFINNAANKKEAGFVNEIMGGGPLVGSEILEQSFTSWKRRERLFTENMQSALNEDLSMEKFEKSSEYSLFTKLTSVELDLENYFSAGNKGAESLSFRDFTMMASNQIQIDGFSEELMDAIGNDLDGGLETILEKSVKKSQGEQSDEGFDFMEKSGPDRSESSSLSKASKEEKATLQRHVMNQVEKQILRTVRVGAKEMSFRLNPPDLGKMHLRLENVRNGLNIKIIAEKSSTHEILVQQAQEFKNQLQSQGMQVAEINVELAHDFDQAMARERKNNSNDSGEGKRFSIGKKGKSGDTADNNPAAGVVFRQTGNSALDLMA